MSYPKILMFGWEFPPFSSGGLGVACSGLSHALAQKTEVIFVLPKRLNVHAHGMRLVFADIKSYEIDSPLSAYATPHSYELLPRDLKERLYGRGLFEEVARYAVKARDIVKREHFDIIHAHDWLSFPAALEAKRISGKPLVVHIHATEFDRTGGLSLNQDVYNIEKLGMERADAVIAVSNLTKNIIIRQYGIPSEKIHVAYNGINLNNYENRNNPREEVLRLKNAGNKMVIFVGRITLQKGPDYFIRAAKRVLEYEPNTYFAIAGSGDMERQMIHFAADLGISNRVLFVGFLRGEELERLYASADLFVLPSVSEPFGIAPLEAIAHGTPIIISKQSGVGEVIRNALKVDFWDVDELANKIVSALRHQSLRDHLREESQKELIPLSWAKVAEICLKIYNTILLKLKS